MNPAGQLYVVDGVALAVNVQVEPFLVPPLGQLYDVDGVAL